MATMFYRTYMTPIISNNTYSASEIDVSDHLKSDGITNLRRSIDAGDYDVGVYTFDDITLTGQNFDGYFNDESDARGIFPYTRDRSKVRVAFVELEDDGSETETTIFRGLISDEATRIDLISSEIKMKALNQLAVIRNQKVTGQSVADGNTIKQALVSILSTTRTESILTVDEANINPNLNIQIDDGSYFDNKPVAEAVNILLLVSNSAMLVNDANEIVVQSRDENTDNDVLNLYGAYDIHRRENIIDITNYNTGQHRMFTSVKVNEIEESNGPLAEEIGVRQKKIMAEFITDNDTELAIAERLLDTFKAPKIELNVKLATSLAKSVRLLDRVSVNFPLRIKPIPGTFAPVIGLTELGDDGDPLPGIYGAIAIDPTLAFKVIQIEDNPNLFTSILKLRQVGTEINDGQYNVVGNCILGFAVLGEAPICGVGDLCETWNPGPLGAGELGCTILG